jgi:hypothetical protein
MLQQSIRDVVISVLYPIFGDSIKREIESKYEPNESKELLRLLDTMLTSYMGEKNKTEVFKEIYKKFPNLKGVI